MRTVAELQEWLKQFDPASRVYAYEGEIVGIVVIDPNDNQLGAFEAPESATGRTLYDDFMEQG